MTMKRLTGLLMSLFFLSGAVEAENTRSITLRYDKEEFEIENADGKSYIIVPRQTTILKEDRLAPALPYFCVYILIGPDEVYVDSDITETETIFEGHINLGNNPETVPTDSTVRSSSEDIPTYKKPSYPDVKADYSGTHIMGGYRYLSFLVTPFRYEVPTQSLYMSTELKIDIRLNTGKIKDRTAVIFSKHSAGLIKKMVVNPDDLEILYGDLTDVAPADSKDRIVHTIDDEPLRYLIITRDSLSAEFQRLAAWKTAKGVKTQVVTLEDIYDNCTGSTNQLKIKQAIKNHYDSSIGQLHYVLLGGDKNVVPIQNCYGKVPTPFYETEAPADLFYACLENINWDANGNGIYGEVTDNVDISPTVALSRLPAGSCQEARIMIDKILGFERNPNISKWNSSILMCAADGGITYTNNSGGMSIHHYASEKMYTNFLANSSWSGGKYRFYDSGTDNDADADYHVTGYNLKKELEKGYSFVNVNSHGSENEWELEGYSTYNNFPASTQTNVSYSFINTEACHTNNLSDSIYLGKRLMINPQSGVVAYYGSSDKGFFDSSMSPFLGPSDYFSGLMLKLLMASDTVNIAEAVRFSKALLSAACSGGYSANRWVYYFLNTLGDPEMPVYNTIPNKFDNVHIKHYNGSFTVFPHEERIFHCLMSRLDQGNSFYEASNVICDSLEYTNLSGEYMLCLTNHNFIPYCTILGPTVYLQNEILDNNINVTSDYTYIGSNVTADRTEGPVSIENGFSVISSRYGVTINNNFEVKTGASLWIETNQPINQ